MIILILLLSIILAIIFTSIRQYKHNKSSKKIKTFDENRYLTMEEKALLREYIESEDEDYKVYRVIGKCYEGTSAFNSKEFYYTIDGCLNVIFPYLIQIEYITGYDIFEIALIDNEYYVISINDIDLTAAHLHTERKLKKQNNWQQGVNIDEHSVQLTQSSENQSEIEPKNETYTIVSQRDITKDELKCIKLRFDEKDHRNRTILVINCCITLFVTMTIVLMSKEKKLGDLTYHFTFLAAFVGAFYFFNQQWLTAFKEPINHIKGYINDSDTEKNKIEISGLGWCDYPPLWKTFIPPVGTVIDAEIKVKSKEIVTLNELFLQKEVKKYGVKQHFVIIIWYMISAFGSPIIFYSSQIMNSRYATNMAIYDMSCYLIVAINLSLWAYCAYKFRLYIKREDAIETAIYNKSYLKP